MASNLTSYRPCDFSVCQMLKWSEASKNSEHIFDSLTWGFSFPGMFHKEKHRDKNRGDFINPHRELISIKGTYITFSCHSQVWWCVAEFCTLYHLLSIPGVNCSHSSAAIFSVSALWVWSSILYIYRLMQRGRTPYWVSWHNVLSTITTICTGTMHSNLSLIWPLLVRGSTALITRAYVLLD